MRTVGRGRAVIGREHHVESRSLRPRLVVLDELPLVDGAVYRVAEVSMGYLAAAARISGERLVAVRDPELRREILRLVTGAKTIDPQRYRPSEHDLIYVARRVNGVTRLFKAQYGRWV